MNVLMTVVTRLSLHAAPWLPRPASKPPPAFHKDGGTAVILRAASRAPNALGPLLLTPGVAAACSWEG